MTGADRTPGAASSPELPPSAPASSADGAGTHTGMHHFAQIGATRIEYAWIAPAAGAASAVGNGPATASPILVFLHEGLGSLALWKDFPDRVCEAVGLRGLVYSRPAYGRSTPRAADEHWGPDFMHRQAIEVLPALLEQLTGPAPTPPLWLFGHSDGASIALIHAARFPERVAGVVSMAAHVFVEDLSLRSIDTARRAYLEQDLRTRLARWHDDVDSAFWGWCNAWLSPAFSDWNLRAELRDIRCPVLAIQGEDDEYGTMAQISAIEASVADTERLALARCGHSPHRAQPQAVIDAVKRFLTTRTAGPDRPSTLETP
jgi:pimeloyl-ACP methyl ester carboxylesterase